MAKNNAVANNETVNNDIQKEEKAMDVKQEAPVQEQQATTPVAAPVATDQQVPAEVPAATPQTFAEKHPKLAAAGEKAKKWGKRLAIAGAVVGGLFVAHKLGEAAGFDKASDAYRNGGQTGNDPEPDESSDDLGEADFEEVSDSEE